MTPQQPGSEAAVAGSLDTHLLADFLAACRGERQPNLATWDAGTRWVLEAYERAGQAA